MRVLVATSRSQRRTLPRNIGDAKPGELLMLSIGFCGGARCFCRRVFVTRGERMTTAATVRERDTNWSVEARARCGAWGARAQRLAARLVERVAHAIEDLPLGTVVGLRVVGTRYRLVVLARDGRRRRSIRLAPVACAGERVRRRGGTDSSGLG